MMMKVLFVVLCLFLSSCIEVNVKDDRVKPEEVGKAFKHMQMAFQDIDKRLRAIEGPTPTPNQEK